MHFINTTKHKTSIHNIKSSIRNKLKLPRFFPKSGRTSSPTSPTVSYTDVKSIYDPILAATMDTLPPLIPQKRKYGPPIPCLSSINETSELSTSPITNGSITRSTLDDFCRVESRHYKLSSHNGSPDHSIHNSSTDNNTLVGEPDENRPAPSQRDIIDRDTKNVTQSPILSIGQNTTEYSMSYLKFIPIYEWPTHEQEIESECGKYVDNEEGCKQVFFNLVKSAYEYKTNRIGCSPLSMDIIFNEEGNIVDLICTDRKKKSHRSMKLKGSIQYIPPELSKNPMYSEEQADIWILGITLYRMLTGKYPFDNSNSDKFVLKSMLRADIQIPHTLSEDARDLIKRLLSPIETRASLDLVLYHPWLKPFNHGLVLTHDIRRPSDTKRHTGQTRGKCMHVFSRLTKCINPCHAKRSL